MADTPDPLSRIDRLEVAITSLVDLLAEGAERRGDVHQLIVARAIREHLLPSENPDDRGTA